MNKVSIVILNYNGANDTIQCVEHLLLLNYKHFELVIVDNASTDNSQTEINNWLGQNSISSEIITNGTKYKLRSKNAICACLISSTENKGFAGGNNIGIKYSLEQEGLDYVWLLNNDTIADTDALLELVLLIKKKENCGICGSIMLEFDNDEIIQGYAGRYFRFSGKTILIQTGKKYCLSNKPATKIDFPIGASMLVSKEFITDVGLLCEDYFLFFEELDWVTRGKKKGWNFDVAWKSKVWHKGSVSIGKSSKKSDFFTIRSRILFTKKFFPHTLPFIYMFMFFFLCNRMKRAQFDRLFVPLRICFQPSMSIQKLLSLIDN